MNPRRLACMSVLLAGTAFGQITCMSGGLAAIDRNSPILARYEDTAALVSDVVFSCPVGTTISAGTVTATLNEPVTSKRLTINGVAASEATLRVTDSTNPGTPAAYAGTVSGSQISFSGVSFPSNAFTLQISNVRINASAAPNGNTNFPITETVFIANQGVALLTTKPVVVGIVTQGFAVPAFTGAFLPMPYDARPNPGSYTICSGNPAASAVPSFQVTIAELFGGGFKSQTAAGVNGQQLCGGATCLLTNGEQGSYTGPVGGVAVAGLGTATHGTRFQLLFANVPQNVTIYLPTSVTNGGLVVNLTGSATGPYSPVGAAVPSVSTVPAGSAPYIAGAGGAVTAYYEVTQTDNTVPDESFRILGYVVAPANFATVAQAPITLTVSPAPVGATDIPTFAASSNPALTLSGFSLCQTNLLFPYITNQLGFDTGIAISNTGADPLPIAFSAQGTAGSCLLNFYGTGAPTPSTSVVPPSPFPATLVPGATGVFVTSSVAIGFQGYMIAQCNFLYAHGFAYVSTQLGMPSGAALGYLASVLPVTRTAAGTESLQF